MSPPTSRTAHVPRASELEIPGAHARTCPSPFSPTFARPPGPAHYLLNLLSATQDANQTTRLRARERTRVIPVAATQWFSTAHLYPVTVSNRGPHLLSTPCRACGALAPQFKNRNSFNIFLFFSFLKKKNLLSFLLVGSTAPCTWTTLPTNPEKFAIMEILMCGFDVLEA